LNRGIYLFKKYFTTYRRPFYLAIVCVSLEAVSDLLGPTIMARILDEGVRAADLGRVGFWGTVMLLVTAAGAVFALIRNALSSRVSQRVGAELRREQFAKILKFSEAGADRIPSGSLITRQTNDISQIVLFVNGAMRIFLKAPITCLGSMALAAMLNFRLSLTVYGVVALVAILITLSMKLSYPRFALLQKAVDRMNSVVQEYLMGVRLVKAFGTYDAEAQRFGAANEGLMRREVSAQMVITLLSPLMTLAIGLGTALIIFLGANLFEAGAATPGDITAFTVYMAQILIALTMMTNIFTIFVRTRASAIRISEVFASEEDFASGGDGSVGSGKVEFDGVRFAYPGGSGLPALDGVSFSVEAGRSLAVIGPTGSGKSTLAWLMMRFYDVSGGRILLDGHDIRELPVEAVRAGVALAPQKALLFSGTVAENLRWGDPEATDEALWDALSMAQADFVRRLPEGLNSLLSGGAVNLSGGQKQRLSIARALVRKAKVLVIDDATSALDALTEAKVRDALTHRLGGRTLIMITQRCTTAMFADSILVLDGGRVAGLGSHKELLETCETYRALYRSQVAGEGALA
jgi:ATP-binding cassette subfamily B protein